MNTGYWGKHTFLIKMGPNWVKNRILVGYKIKNRAVPRKTEAKIKIARLFYTRTKNKTAIARKIDRFPIGANCAYCFGICSTVAQTLSILRYSLHSSLLFAAPWCIALADWPLSFVRSKHSIWTYTRTYGHRCFSVSALTISYIYTLYRLIVSELRRPITSWCGLPLLLPYCSPAKAQPFRFACYSEVAKIYTV